MSRANSAPVITFSVPALQVTPVPVRGTLARTRTDSAGQISPTPLLPRPPRCLTPYPDTSNFPNSLEPSPLSSPAFSAYSVNASTNGGTDVDNDVEDDEDGVKVDLNEPQSPQEVMSPGAKARADHARLLGPALHMSHMNSPIDHKFKLPLSPMPMSKLRIEAEEGMISPIYRGPSPVPFIHSGEKGDQQEEVPVFKFSCDSPPSTTEAVSVWLDDQQKHKALAGRRSGVETAVEMGGAQSVDFEEALSKSLSTQVLEVHVETVD